MLELPEVLRPGTACAEGFDPFGEQQKKKASSSLLKSVRMQHYAIRSLSLRDCANPCQLLQAPKDLKNPPPDAQVLGNL